jgi:hypothetical protein
MEADDLLGQLGRHVREEDAGATDADPIWERLARGELSEAEDAQLRARAGADPEVAALYEAYRPLATELKERLVQQATSELSRPAPARVLPWRRVAFAVAAPLAAAAAAALVLALRRPVEPVTAPLPAYALAFTGGDRATRSGEVHDDGPIELQPGSRMEIVLRPSTAVAGAVVVKAFLVQGGEAHAWAVPMDRSSDGAVRISGEAGPLLGVPAGSWDLAFVVGRDGALIVDAAEVARAARGEAGAHPWQLLERHVRLLDGK